MAQSAGETSAEAPGQRLFLIRLALGRGAKNPMRIRDFVALVAEVTGVDYDESAISRSENGLRELSLSDVANFAAVDPKGRGKLWLGWGEEEAARPAAATASLKTYSPDEVEQMIAEAVAKVKGKAGPRRRRGNDQ